MKPLKILSLGAGVQSTTLLLLAERGELERPDRAIFADTGWEPPSGTITTRDRYAVVNGDYMRMLTAQECRAAMGFPAEYALPRSHKLAVHMLGNAVCPPVARELVRQVLEVA